MNPGMPTVEALSPVMLNDKARENAILEVFDEAFYGLKSDQYLFVLKKPVKGKILVKREDNSKIEAELIHGVVLYIPLSKSGSTDRRLELELHREERWAQGQRWDIPP